MKTNEIAASFGVFTRAFRRGLPAFNPPLEIERPFLGVTAAQEGLIDMLPLAPNLRAP